MAPVWFCAHLCTLGAYDTWNGKSNSFWLLSYARMKTAMKNKLNMFYKYLNMCRKIHTTPWIFKKQSDKKLHNWVWNFEQIERLFLVQSACLHQMGLLHFISQWLTLSLQTWSGICLALRDLWNLAGFSMCSSLSISLPAFSKHLHISIWKSNKDPLPPIWQ